MKHSLTYYKETRDKLRLDIEARKQTIYQQTRKKS